MNPRFAFYTPADFGRVLQFLKVHAGEHLPYDAVRFQFCMGLHVPFVDNGIQGGFERTCGLWEDEEGLVALVLTEGGTLWGETFLAFRSERDKTPELMGRICDFAERFTSKVSEYRKSNAYKLCVPKSDATLEAFVRARGYCPTEARERYLVKAYAPEPEPVVLPEGFILRDARSFPPFFSALAHNHAFRYRQDNDGAERGFAALRTLPDYRPELDLVVFDPEGQPAGLANFWINEHTHTAELEPLGVVWWYRRMGLATALINEGIRRTQALGCMRMSGGDQPFYWSLGFEPIHEYGFWAWSSDGQT